MTTTVVRQLTVASARFARALHQRRSAASSARVMLGLMLVVSSLTAMTPMGQAHAAPPRVEGPNASSRACGASGGGPALQPLQSIPIATCSINVDAPGTLYITASAAMLAIPTSASSTATTAQFFLTVDGATAPVSQRTLTTAVGATDPMATQAAVPVTAGNHTVFLFGRQTSFDVAAPTITQMINPAVSVYFIPTTSPEAGCRSTPGPTVALPSTGNTTVATCTLTLTQPSSVHITAGAGMSGAAFLTNGVEINGDPFVQGLDWRVGSVLYTTNLQGFPELPAGTHTISYRIRTTNAGGVSASNASVQAIAIPVGSEGAEQCVGGTTGTLTVRDSSFVSVLDGCVVSSPRAQVQQVTAVFVVLGEDRDASSVEFQLMVDGVLQGDTIRPVTIPAEDLRTVTLTATRALSAGAHTISVHARKVSGDDIQLAGSVVIRLVADLPGAIPIQTGSSDYVPVIPDRVLDTRPDTATGYAGPKPGPGQIIQLDVTGTGTSQVPENARSVVLNVTGTEATTDGYVTVWPCGTPRPTASNLNLTAGGTTPNLVVAKIGVGGLVCLFTQTGTHLIADINGYMPSTSTYTPVNPERLLDTRSAAKPTAGTTIEVQVTATGTTNVPGTATAAVLNVTGIEADTDGFVTVWPCGTPRPTASNLNLTAGGTTPNLVVAKIGVGGKVCIFTQTGMHVIADINGYMPAGSSYVSVNPERLLDTRAEGQAGYAGPKPAAGATIELTIAGAGVTAVPAGTNAAVLNITGVGPDTNGFVTIWPCGTPRPTASNLNLTSGTTTPNLVMTKLGDGGKICIFTQTNTHLIADINGYWP